MKNLDEAFLKAYAKTPRQTHQLPEASVNTPHTAALAPRRAAVKNTEHTPELRSAQESTSTAVVSKRTTAKSATIRKPSDSASVTSTRIDGPDDRYHRIDHVQPQSPDLSVLAPEAKAPAKKVKRQPLSEYLAEMRQQMAELEQHSESREYELIPEYTSPAPAARTHQPTKPAVYTYPDVNASKLEHAEPASEPASSSFVDKRTLRQLASSAGPVVPSAAPVMSSAIDEVSDVPHTTSPKHASDVFSREHEETTTAPTQFEPVTVRQSWREAERMYRVDSDAHSVKTPRSPEPTIEKSAAKQSRTDSSTKTREYPVFKKSEEQLLPSKIDTEYDWKPSHGTASLAMVESLASYSPKPESSGLNRSAKTTNSNEKARTEQKLAQSNESIVAPLNPEWEVDSFQWPTTVLELLEAQEKAFEQIASHLTVANSKGLKMIAITSAERGVGKSTTCMCLAALMAHKGLKVAIIDGDAENPSLVNQMNMEISHGWQDCIRANVPLESVAVKAVEEGVTLFPLTDAVSHEELNSNSVKINHLLRRIAKSFDLVFVDTHRVSYRSSQLIGTGEHAALDAALVIVDAELSVKDRIDTTLQLLRDQKIGSIGVVENFSNLELATNEGS